MKPFILTALLVAMPVAASDLPQATNTVASADVAGARSQKRIDDLDDATREKLEQTRAAIAEAEQLQLYNRQMENVVASQSAERQSITAQIASIDETEQGLLPLMQNMVQQLRSDINAGIPFLRAERLARVEHLQAALGRGDISVSEKYRRIMEALQIEVEYTRTIESYREREDGVSYDYLRVGSIGFYRRTLDGTTAWQWLDESWQEVPPYLADELAVADKVARQVITPQLITLPMIAPEEP